MVEVALILVSLISFTCGSIDFSLLFTACQGIDNAVREGARLGVVLPYSATSAAEWRNAVADRVNTKLAVLRYLPDYQISVQEPRDIDGDDVPDRMITVSVIGNYSFRFLTAIGIEATPISRSITMRYEWRPSFGEEPAGGEGGGAPALAPPEGEQPPGDERAPSSGE